MDSRRPYKEPADAFVGDPAIDIGFPGLFPFTRGIQPTMYRGRLWTMRQYAGFGSATESNERYRYLLANGVSGLSVAFDLPTQIGYDSDHPLASGEVGRVGVAIDSIDDMDDLFAGIPLDRVSTSMTINATAIILLSLYIVVGKRQGVPPASLAGTVQNDILKEYVARGTYIFPPPAVAAHRHRHFCVLRSRAAQLEHDLDQRISHSRSRIDGCSGGRLHAGTRRSPTSRPRSMPGST